MEIKKTSVDGLLEQLESFEKTVNELAKNIGVLKEKLVKNKEAYGSDISKWPQTQTEK